MCVIPDKRLQILTIFRWKVKHETMNLLNSWILRKVLLSTRGYGYWYKIKHIITLSNVLLSSIWCRFCLSLHANVSNSYVIFVFFKNEMKRVAGNGRSNCLFFVPLFPYMIYWRYAYKVNIWATCRVGLHVLQ